MRKVAFTPTAWTDFSYIIVNDKAQAKKILKLITEIQRTPFKGIGKPEALKYELTGYWSRRIDEKNRLVYAADDDNVVIIQCSEHY